MSLLKRTHFPKPAHNTLATLVLEKFIIQILSHLPIMARFITLQVKKQKEVLNQHL